MPKQYSLHKGPWPHFVFKFQTNILIPRLGHHCICYYLIKSVSNIALIFLIGRVILFQLFFTNINIAYIMFIYSNRKIYYIFLLLILIFFHLLFFLWICSPLVFADDLLLEKYLFLVLSVFVLLNIFMLIALLNTSWTMHVLYIPRPSSSLG